MRNAGQLQTVPAAEQSRAGQQLSTDVVGRDMLLADQCVSGGEMRLEAGYGIWVSTGSRHMERNVDYVT